MKALPRDLRPCSVSRSPERRAGAPPVTSAREARTPRRPRRAASTPRPRWAGPPPRGRSRSRRPRPRARTPAARRRARRQWWCLAARSGHCCARRWARTSTIGRGHFVPDMLTPVLSDDWDNDRPWTLESYEQAGGYSALGSALELDQDAVIDLVKESGLRGRGGGGLPARHEGGLLPPGGGEPPPPLPHTPH